MLSPTLACLAAIVSGPSCAQDLPLLVGGHAHGEANIQALADLGLGNFVWIPAQCYSMGNTPWDEHNDITRDVQACLDSGLRFMFSVRRGLSDVTRAGGYTYGGHADEFHDEGTVRAIVQRAGEALIGVHCEEMDADFLQQALRPSFRTRTPELFAFTDRAGGRKALEDRLGLLGARYRDWGTRDIMNMCVTFHHSGFRAGAGLVIAELLEHLPTTELQLAYLRGGARQFSADWGVWVSPWWIGKVPCEDKQMWPAEQAQPKGGHSASAFRRCLYESFVSGARLLCCQETEPLIAGDGEGGYRLAEWGRELKSFWQYARQHDEPMDPIASLGVLVDKDNGWAPAHLWIDWNLTESVWGKLPADRSDAMLAEYLDVLLPGFGRTREAVMERTDTYPGYFAATPVGPFDIVSSDVSADALSHYPSVVLLGGIRMTPELLANLRKYVAAGGTLLINVLQMIRDESFVQDEELLGATIGAGQWTQISSSTKILCKEPIPGVTQDEFEEPWYAPVNVSPTSAKVLATDHEGHAVLLRNSFGEGTVLLSTPEYMQEGWAGQRHTLGFFRQVLAGLAAAGPVEVSSEGDLSWLAARQGQSSVLVLLVNHASDAREARVAWREPARSAQVEVGVCELVVGKQPAATTYTVSVPAQDVILLRIAQGA